MNAPAIQHTPVKEPGRLGYAVFGGICLVALTWLSVHAQVKGVSYGILHHKGQMFAHLYVIEGTAGDPWVYRVLCPWICEAALRIVYALDWRFDEIQVFVALRAVQNFVIFLAAYAFYRRLGLGRGSAWLGCALLAWGMTHCFYDSDLQFNTYQDLLFYLLAAGLVLEGRSAWVPVVMMGAALNRETSGLIPLMGLGMAWAAGGWRGIPRREWLIAAAGMAVFGAVYVGLRLWRPGAEMIRPHGINQGMDLLYYNLFHPLTGPQILLTWSILPLMAWMGWRRWPRELVGLFWAVVPVWMVVHTLMGILAESRLLLVPMALVIVPGALFWAAGGQRQKALENGGGNA